jgi:pimeloyl-ACP methyl ester carboxylesterase
LYTDAICSAASSMSTDMLHERVCAPFTASWLIDSSISVCSTSSPAPTASASRPSLADSAISASATETSAGMVGCGVLASSSCLMFIHGVLMNATVWREVVADLRRDHRCIVPTLPLGRTPLTGHATVRSVHAVRVPTQRCRVAVRLVQPGA